MSDQETKPAEAASSPVENIDLKIPDVKSETTKTDDITQPETTSEVSGIKPDEKVTVQEDAGKEADSTKSKKTQPSIHNPPEGMLRTEGRRRNDEDCKKNNKFDPSTLPDTDDPNLIRTQV